MKCRACQRIDEQPSSRRQLLCVPEKLYVPQTLRSNTSSSMLMVGRSSGLEICISYASVAWRHVKCRQSESYHARPAIRVSSLSFAFPGW